MTSEPGLRERKKQQTRRLIAESAARLFSDRGFDTVTVAEVARLADVSEVTVFNYFPAKEDLFYGGMEFFEEKLLQAVGERPPGESVLTAFRQMLLDSSSRLARRDAVELIAATARIISASPALQAREREIVARYTMQLAAMIAEETNSGPDDVEPSVVANALMGAHRALVAFVRTRVLSGRRGSRLAEEFRLQAVSAFARLEAGLAAYAAKPG
ncbi:MAG: TetR/AcrR family transcriptional regulator [Candidatus Dormibacteraeota bacterium]|nr:TetR/AcrR family transcriptional regulator [Candidatus Dormibacteraeota bacterium]